MRAVVFALFASAILTSDALAQRRQMQGAPQSGAPMQGEGRAQLEGQVRREFGRGSSLLRRWTRAGHSSHRMRVRQTAQASRENGSQNDD